MRRIIYLGAGPTPRAVSMIPTPSRSGRTSLLSGFPASVLRSTSTTDLLSKPLGDLRRHSPPHLHQGHLVPRRHQHRRHLTHHSRYQSLTTHHTNRSQGHLLLSLTRGSLLNPHLPIGTKPSRHPPSQTLLSRTPQLQQCITTSHPKRQDYRMMRY